MTENGNKHQWMPVAAGILTLIAGGTKLLAFIGFLIALFFVPVNSYSYWDNTPHMMWSSPNFMIAAMAVLLTLGVLAVVGGVFMLQRRMWGLSLVGAIAALFPNSLLGIAAVILLALSKNQFDVRTGPEI